MGRIKPENTDIKNNKKKEGGKKEVGRITPTPARKTQPKKVLRITRESR